MDKVNEHSILDFRLAHLLSAVPTERIWRYLYDKLVEEFQVGGIAVLLYRNETLPLALYGQGIDNRAEDRISTYVQGAYLLDPFFHAAEAQKQGGVYAISDLAPSNFVEGEYYTEFFSPYGIGDELNVFIPISSDATIAISIGRQPGDAPFGGHTSAFLNDSYKFLEIISKRSVAEYAARPKTIDDATMARFHNKLKGALEAVGSKVLSPREKDVLDHLLKGYSVRTAAERLGIAIGTVRIHRHNIYSKLDIKTQNELFALVIEAIKHFDPLNSSDPLSDFLPPNWEEVRKPAG